LRGRHSPPNYRLLLPTFFQVFNPNVPRRSERRCEIPYVTEHGARRAPPLIADIARGAL
jgi:hypothetical protein